MKPRILIDATTVIDKKSGLSQYIISLLDNLPEEAFERYHFLVLVHTNLIRKELWEVLDKKNFEIIKAAITPIGPRREWDMFWFLREHKVKFDLFHSTSSQYPLFLKNGLATVHDITFKKYLDSKWWTFNMAKRFLDLVIKNALYRSTAVIAVSEYVKQDLVNNYRLNNKRSNKITVIHEGWEHLTINAEEKEAGDRLPEFSNYLFYVGTTRLHKNMKNLLQAFNIASKKLPEAIKLVIAGNETYLSETDKAIVAEINAGEERIFFTGFVSGYVLQHLFTNADAFIFPSLSEGFGIPVLESFYFKKPLLCSNTTSLPEIGGDAAVYFDPADPESIAGCIVKFYSDNTLAAGLVSKGTERLKLFSWKKMAQETVELYKDILKV